MSIVNQYGVQRLLGRGASLGVHILPWNAVAREQHRILVHCQGRSTLLVHWHGLAREVARRQRNGGGRFATDKDLHSQKGLNCCYMNAQYPSSSCVYCNMTLHCLRKRKAQRRGVTEMTSWWKTNSRVNLHLHDRNTDEQPCGLPAKKTCSQFHVVQL